MSAWILPGALGLLGGLLLRWTRLSRPGDMRRALALRVSHALRSLVMALGTGLALTALMMWLAVIDVDGVVVLPLSAGVLAGGAIFGAAVALSGYTPLTAFAGAANADALGALCTLAGCLAGTWAAPLLEAPLARLRELPPLAAATLFRVTLDEPFLLGGGFAGQACAGLLLMAIAACIPSNRRMMAASKQPAPTSLPEEPAPLLCLPAPEAPAPAAEEPSTGEADPAEETPADDDPEPAFIALLPGEEPLVLDAAPPEEVSDTPEGDDPPPPDDHVG